MLSILFTQWHVIYVSTWWWFTILHCPLINRDIFKFSNTTIKPWSCCDSPILSCIIHHHHLVLHKPLFLLCRSPSVTQVCWWFLRRSRTAAYTKWPAATDTTGCRSCVGSILVPKPCCSAREDSTARVWWACSSLRTPPPQVCIHRFSDLVAVLLKLSDSRNLSPLKLTIACHFFICLFWLFKLPFFFPVWVKTMWSAF